MIIARPLFTFSKLKTETADQCVRLFKINKEDTQTKMSLLLHF